MNIANLYRKLRQILDYSNIALINKGLSAIDSLFQIPSEIEKLGEINILPYVLRKEIIEITKDDIVNVTTIRKKAFQSCTNLTSVIIPDSVTTIGEWAFAYCNNLKNIYLKPTTPPSLGGTNAIPTITTIHVPIGCGDAYKNATNWSYHATRIIEDPEL